VLTEPLHIAYLTMTVCAYTQWFIVLSYYNYWDLLPGSSFKKLLAWMICVTSVLGIPFVQAALYHWITSENAVSDVLFKGLIIVEMLISTVLLARSVLKRRPKASS